MVENDWKIYTGNLNILRRIWQRSNGNTIVLISEVSLSITICDRWDVALHVRPAAQRCSQDGQESQHLHLETVTQTLQHAQRLGSAEQVEISL